MEMKLRPEFVFSKEVNLLLRQIMVGEFVALRNEACELLNQNYDKWNAEFIGDAVKNPDEYNKYICEKQRPIIDKVNEKARVILLDLTDDCDICCTLKKDPSVKMEMFLVEIK